MSTKRRIICVGHVVPYPPRAGNEYRFDRLLRWLDDAGWDVLPVLCPSVDPGEAVLLDAAARYRNLVVCRHDGRIWHRTADPLLDGGAWNDRQGSDVGRRLGEDDVDPSLARVVNLQRGFCPDHLVDVVEYLDRVWEPEVVLTEYAFMARPFPLLRPDALTVIDTIDVFSTKQGKVEKHGVSDGYAMSDDEEAWLLHRADVLIGIQRGESAILERLSPHSTVVTVGIDISVGDAGTDPSDQPTALIVASDNPMNVAGLNGFLTEAWPTIRAAVPGARLRVVGAVGQALSVCPDGVDIVGHADEIAPEYATARVAINPAVAGTGLKVKTIEALGHLRPVVCWPAGVDGLGDVPRRHCDVVPDWAGFASSVIGRLSDASALDELNGSRDALASMLSPAAVYEPLRRVLEGERLPAPRPSPSRRRRPRVVTLLARYGSQAYPTALDDVEALFARQLPQAGHEVVVVDNALPVGFVGRHESVDVIGGSNSAWEFSAWDEAIAHLGPRLDDFDFVNLTTSAFRQLYVHYLDRFDVPMLESLGGRRAAVGHIDHYNEPVTLFGIRSRAWLRSSFVVLPPAELRRLGTLVTIADRAAIFSGDPAEPFRHDAPLSSSYRRTIAAWLTGEGTGQGVVWHSRQRLTADILPRFEDKALAILNEQMLTNRLLAQGTAIVDATWLATTTEAHGGRTSIDLIPGWHDQLAARDTDPVPLAAHR